MSLAPDYWNEAISALSKADKILAKVIDSYAGEFLKSRSDPFFSLAKSIVSQQISVAAASSVWNKMEDSIKIISPEIIIKSSDEDLRKCGLSRQKISYLNDLSAHFIADKINLKSLRKMTDEEVIVELTRIKGIGRWTAEMFLIFCLARQDVFPIADIGLQKAMKKLYSHKSQAEMQKLAENWKPWRTVATWYLWRSLDPIPVEY